MSLQRRPCAPHSRRTAGVSGTRSLPHVTLPAPLLPSSQDGQAEMDFLLKWVAAAMPETKVILMAMLPFR